MTTHPYVLLGTYPGSAKAILVNTGEKHVASTEENLFHLRELAEKLVEQNVLETVQIYKAYSEVITRKLR